MKMVKYTILTIAAALMYTCKGQAVNAQSKEDQRYRPNYHFTPKSGWMNDPNGMFYLNGTYHLFFQHYPDSNKWGPMHWGHATSKDLIRWEEQPIALFPDQLGYIFSGSAVVDTNNTSGLGDGKNVPIVAIFTYHDIAKEKANQVDVESQGIAYSLDKGKTWVKYSNNPVLRNPGIRDFRDPKVFWDQQSQQWIMTLAAQDRAHFYGSKNLKDWSLLSEFGKEIGAHGGVWECPDLFPVKIKGTNEQKWALIISINPGGPNGGSVAQYFIGDFDGKTFTMDPHFTQQLAREKAVWLDWGKDNYAPVTWDNAPEGKRLMIGWMSNWDYAQDVPTEKWRSATTIAREITLTKNEEGYKLRSMPVSQLSKYRGKSISKNKVLAKEMLLVKKDELNLAQSAMTINLKDLKEDTYTFTASNALGEKISFGINNKDHYLFIDRQNSGKTNFGNNFSTKISKAQLSKSYSEVSFNILLDKTSLEIFFNNGEEVMTEIFFPTKPYTALSVSSDARGTSVSMEGHQLNIK
ncbi:glycoside hydrolase family 32 protein [Chryseobacterium antibioticum]|uniref:Glycoside hydrolase family 32 protein n=1 Tax=Chryseobacterium pyrolae TaxID=2987481 RepID=A0ABT2IBS2_9FLAO|nr:glycoside hydrolase family 32 protein [Chryseobacterium pyrolae]MCT2406080.1 glycoside hydrolase family 32 protein [Chryseobacterium pyrolae]